MLKHAKLACCVLGLVPMATGSVARAEGQLATHKLPASVQQNLAMLPVVTATSRRRQPPPASGARLGASGQSARVLAATTTPSGSI